MTIVYEPKELPKEFDCITSTDVHQNQFSKTIAFYYPHAQSHGTNPAPKLYEVNDY